MSSWYTRAELTRRISWFYSGSALANMFGGLLGAAILGNLDGDFGLAGWRWLFIVEGTITIGIAILASFFLPNYPATTSWLSEEEKTFAAWRLLADVNEEDERHARSAMAGLKLALQDYRLYLFILFQHLSLLSQTFQYFFPAIVGTLGYGAIDTLWLTAPVWVSRHVLPYPIYLLTMDLRQFATFLISIFVTWTSARTGDRSIHIICLMLVAVVGNAIATATTNTGARFFAMFLMPVGAVSACKDFGLIPHYSMYSIADISQRPDHRILGGQLLSETDGQTFRIDCNCEYDWQYSFHLRELHVS